MNNFKCVVSYKGTNYCGSQRQKNQKTIQGEIEKAINIVTGEDITLVVAGRTDSGVHATCQVINFKSETKLKPYSLRKLLNRNLASDISILDIEIADDKFNARFDAKQKTYCYNFYLSEEVNPVIDDIALQVPFKVDIQKMSEACNYLIGTHDFCSFMSSGAKIKDSIRTILDAKIIKRENNLYSFEITGKSFLYNMVRIIMGVLLKVGDGTLAPQDLVKIIDSKQRPKTKTASAKGLILKEILY